MSVIVACGVIVILIRKVCCWHDLLRLLHNLMMRVIIIQSIIITKLHLLLQEILLLELAQKLLMHLEALVQVSKAK